MVLKPTTVDTVIAPAEPRDLPDSTLLSPESLALVAEWNQQYQDFSEACCAAGLDLEGKAISQIPTLRLQQAELFYQSPLYQKAINRYPVDITTMEIADVTVEEITPRARCGRCQ